MDAKSILGIVFLALVVFLTISGMIHIVKEKKRAPWGRFPASKRPFVSDEVLRNLSIEEVDKLLNADVAYLADCCDCKIYAGQEEFERTYQMACMILESRRKDREYFMQRQVLPSGVAFPKGVGLLHCKKDFLEILSKKDRQMLYAYAKSKVYEGDERFLNVCKHLAKTL